MIDAVTALVRAKQFEAALLLLQRMHQDVPENISVEQSLEMLKRRLLRDYIEYLGGVDGVPVLLAMSAALPPDAGAVIDLVNGRDAFADIIAQSPLGAFRTLQLLCELAKREVLAIEISAERPHLEALVEAYAAEPLWGLVSPTEYLPDDTVLDPPRRWPASTAQFRAAPKHSNRLDDDAYTQLFHEATHAYLQRNFGLAKDLFARCVELRPTDARARYNWGQIARRQLN